VEGVDHYGLCLGRGLGIFQAGEENRRRWEGKAGERGSKEEVLACEVIGSIEFCDEGWGGVGRCK